MRLIHFVKFSVAVFLFFFLAGCLIAPAQAVVAENQDKLERRLLPGMDFPGQGMDIKPTVYKEQPPETIEPESPASAVAAPEERSSFEAYVLSRGLELRQFGYELFRTVPSTFAPVESLPVGPDYVVGPNDEIRISLWGRVNAEYNLFVDREGQVKLPFAGVVTLAGLTFPEAKDFLHKELSRYYNPNEVKMNVSMGALRSIRVFVVGKAVRPGSYTISSLSTLVNALFASGGPGKSGSMRNVQVKRGGETVTSFDLYDFLIKGDKTKDVKLEPEDVIFISTAGPLVALAGDVKVPAIYELKGETTLKQLLEMSGGLNETAFSGRLQVERISENSRSVVIESSLDKIKPADFKIEPGDIIRFFTIVSDRKIVRIAGAVFREGEYGIGAGMTVKDLIEMSGGLAFNAFYEDAELTRVIPAQSGPETKKIHFNLKKALSDDKEHNIGLEPNDFILVRPIPEWELYRTVELRGEVRFPGVYTVMKGERLSSVIKRAGGFTGKAYIKGAVFTRESVKQIQQNGLDESIDRLEQELLVHSVEAGQQVLGEEDVKIQQSVLARQKFMLAKMRTAKALGRVIISSEGNGTSEDSYEDIVLEHGDFLSIPEMPSQVQVMGAVYNQTAFLHKLDMSVGGYIKKSGGLTRTADEDEIYILKVDGTASKANGWGLNSSRLDPGDTIVVPQEIEKTYWLKELKDITQILYQIAVTAGVLIVAF